MAEGVKLNKRLKLPELLNDGDRISVSRTFFDTGKQKYSETLPDNIKTFEGTVIKLIDSTTGRIEVCWDDGKVSHTYSNKVNKIQNPIIESGQLCNLMYKGQIIFKGVRVQGTVVHGTHLDTKTFGKFEIKDVTNGEKWEKFDEDIHCVGTYISWKKVECLTATYLAPEEAKDV